MENSGLSLTDIKRDNRNLKRKLSKMRRKAETMRKLRTQNYELTRQIQFVQEDIKAVSSYMWTPPAKYED